MKVRKVDVERCAAGTDHHVKGFRYYLNRPYIVVGRQISVSTQLVPVRMATYPGTAKVGEPNSRIVYVGLVPDKYGNYLIYDADGNEEPTLTVNDVAPISPPPAGPQGNGQTGTASASSPTINDGRLMARVIAFVVTGRLELSPPRPIPPNMSTFRKDLAKLSWNRSPSEPHPLRM